jgi:copper chaperone
METLKFKTNIKCGGCVAGVTPQLNQLTDIKKWEVDLENPDKILTVEGKDDLEAQEVIDAVESAGFKAERYIAD